MMTSLEKQLNWGLKKVFFRSICKSSRRLRIKKQVIGIEQRTDQLSIFYLRKYIRREKSAFNTTLILLSAKYSINERTQKIIFHDHRSTSFLDKSFHALSRKWNSLPNHLRDFKTSNSVLKKLFIKHYKDQIHDSVNNLECLSWRDFRLV